MLFITISQAIAAQKVITPYAETEMGKRKYWEVLDLSNAKNFLGLTRTLPELELLWKEDPKGYLHAISIAVLALVDSPDPDTTAAVLKTISRVQEKKCPDDAEVASFYFSAKSTIIGYSGRYPKVRENQQHFLLNADLLKEVRSQRIPNYRNRGVENPADEILNAAGVAKVEALPTEGQKVAVAKAVAQNKKNQKMDRLQETLSLLDKNLAYSLTAYAPKVGLPKDKKIEFFRQLGKRADFTAEEQQKLQASDLGK